MLVAGHGLQQEHRHPRKRATAINEGFWFAERLTSTPLAVCYDSSCVLKKCFTEQNHQRELHPNANGHCLLVGELWD